MFLHKYFATAQVAYLFFRFCIIFYLLNAGHELRGLILGEVLSYALLFLLQSYGYRRGFSRNIKTAGKIEINTKRLVRYGGFSYFNEMGAKILDVSSDLIIISAFLGPASAGIYALANRVMSLISRMMPHRIFREVIRPAFFTKYIRDNNRKELENMVNMLTKFIAFFFIPVMVAVWVLGEKIIIHIFDPKYINSLNILWIAAAFTALNSVQFPLGMVTQAIERPEINLYSKVFSIYNIIADILVIKYFGIVGVAVVTGSAILFKNIFIYRYTQRYVSFSIDLKPLGRIILNALVMGVLLMGLKGFAVNILSLIVVSLIGGISYLLISFLNKSFSVKERETINRILPRPVFLF